MLFFLFHENNTSITYYHFFYFVPGTGLSAISSFVAFNLHKRHMKCKYCYCAPFIVAEAEAWRFGVLLELFSSCSQEPDGNISCVTPGLCFDLLSRDPLTAHSYCADDTFLMSFSELKHMY